MYLKSLEMIGFKSFANRTKLEFEPGMTAIVGPNGCGKSNVSDAIRWVLGEQRASALRGGKMEDVIFAGTDQRKPLNMAEVSIAFAGCEGVLGTEFDEVTITRRVFRSGEGQYFINRTVCRLKDIQRLFMDTGIGTSSYSFMEQGRIDRILSSRPEDRRAVFEEASGITKFKSDKKEALRKLEQTDANLLRLADVIQEVKRQIGSLQRQAAKARRYKEIKDHLRGLDLHVTRQRVTLADQQIVTHESALAALAQEIESRHAGVQRLEQESHALREQLVAAERDIGASLEAATQAQGRLDHTLELIETNRQRIEEYRRLTERDTQEIAATRDLLDQATAAVAATSGDLDRTQADVVRAEADHKARQTAFSEQQQRVTRARQDLQRMRNESVEAEMQVSRLQNQLLETETRERAALLQRERLAAEKTQLQRSAQQLDQREAELGATLKDLRDGAAAAEQALRDTETERTRNSQRLREAQESAAGLQARLAAVETRIGMLKEGEESRAGFPAGARQLLNPANKLEIERESLRGPLADQIETDPAHRTALEAALRPWSDSLIARDTAAARALLERLRERKAGAARLVVCPTSAPARGGDTGDRLIAHVRCPDSLRPLIESLIGHVRLVADAAALPAAPAPDEAYVTPDGLLFRGATDAEWWQAESGNANPVSRRLALSAEQTARADLRAQLDAARETGQAATRAGQALDTRVGEARRALEEARRAVAHREGELQVLGREAREARKRLETVSWELDALEGRDEQSGQEKQDLQRRIETLRARRETLANAIAEQSRALADEEQRQSETQTAATDARIHLAAVAQRADYLRQQLGGARNRIKELTQAIEGRSAGMQTYAGGMERLARDSAAAEGRLDELRTAVTAAQARVADLRARRDAESARLREQDKQLAAERDRLDDQRADKSERDLKLAEMRMRRQNQVDRATQEYGVTVEDLLAAPEPVWEGDPLPFEAAETAVAELRAKLEGMGPVNLVAIEEYKEHEERFAFLTAQEQDLIRAKQQLTDMIRKIDLTTTELFSKTFEQVNTNFEKMFTRLFNGGTAKLVLVNEEDVLDCGIEIIARPPGKRLQSVSLLSGGERTLTAVALLFAIYLIKPSPFCFLDELDAPLDEANIGRFVTTLQDFLQYSQFVVITHSRQTISAADILYGVTMPEKGISKLVSMRFRPRGPAPTAASTPDTAPAPAPTGDTAPNAAVPTDTEPTPPEA